MLGLANMLNDNMLMGDLPEVTPVFTFTLSELFEGFLLFLTTIPITVVSLFQFKVFEYYLRSTVGQRG